MTTGMWLLLVLMTNLISILVGFGLSILFDNREAMRYVFTDNIEEQIKTEKYSVNDKIRGYVVNVERGAK